jgi:hypothetical protein
MKKNEQFVAQPRRGCIGLAEAVRKRIETLQFGSVQLVLRDRRVVQIETTEKTWLEKVEN